MDAYVESGEVSYQVTNINEIPIKRSNSIYSQNNQYSHQKSGNAILDIGCKTHGKTEIIIDTKTLRLVCKKCMESGVNTEDNLEALKGDTTSVGELNPSDFLDEEDDFCYMHTTEKIIFYCEDCKDLLCKMCFNQHRSHNTSMPEIVRENLILSFVEDIQKLKLSTPKMEESIKAMGEINGQIKSYNSNIKIQLNKLNTNLDKTLKEKLKHNYDEFVQIFENIDKEVEESFNRLNIASKRCSKFILDISEIETNIKMYKSNLKLCEYIKRVSSVFNEAKRVSVECSSFLCTKLKNIKTKGESELKKFTKLIENYSKKQRIYENSVINSTLTGANCQSYRLRRFFKYSIEDLAYFRTSTVFLSANKKIIVTGIGICGLLKGKNDRNLSINISINEISVNRTIDEGTKYEISNTLHTENSTLTSIINSYDPSLCFYLSKVITLEPGSTYAITCLNLEKGSQYVELYRGKVYFPSNSGSKEPVQDIKCNNTRIDFKFTPSKGVESDFNELSMGIISDVIYSPV